MTGRSGPQSFLLSHTKPVTAQVSHFRGEQAHILGAGCSSRGLKQLSEHCRVHVLGMETTFEKWEHITIRSVFLPVHLQCL